MEPDEDERNWAMFGHLSSLVGVLVTSGAGGWIGPLIIWLVKKPTMPYAAEQAKEALNFNITLAIIGVALVLLTVVTLGVGIVLAVPVGIALAVTWLVLTIVAAMKAKNGEAYRYPFSLRLVS